MRLLYCYPIGLSMYENIAYYTLVVAYGNSTGQYPDDELEALRTKLYYSNLSAGMSSAQRGTLGMEYDRTSKEQMEYIRKNGSGDIKPLILKIMEIYLQSFVFMYIRYADRKSGNLCGIDFQSRSFTI